MDSLDSAFDELVRTLPTPSQLRPQGADPLFYLVYRPSEALEVKRRIPAWRGRLQRDLKWKARVISWSDLMNACFDANENWERLVELESDFDVTQVNQSITQALQKHLMAQIEPYLTRAEEGTVNLFVDTELLHPYFRSRSVEGHFHDRIAVPTVIFYPGRRSGTTGLSFLGTYPDDSSYRATIIGGLQ